MFEFIRNYVKSGLKIIFIILKCARNVTKDLTTLCFPEKISWCSPCGPCDTEEIHFVLR